MKNSKKVLIIDDSAFMRRILSDIINYDPRCIVIGTAKNGKEGLTKIRELNPDVITLDVEMPIMNGLEMLEELSSQNLLKPVILLSTLAKEGAEATIRALELGAVDFICKPQNIFQMNHEGIQKEIIEKIITVSSVGLRAIKTRNKRIETGKVIKKISSENTKLKKIVAIGTSTGGPKALQEVIPFIPGDIPAAFLIVQHMPAGFTKSLADRLNALSQLQIKEAEDGDVIRAGHGYIAPGNYHVFIEKVPHSTEFCIRLSTNPPVGGHRPSVNVMMNSLSSTNFQSIIGVIMTGMGSDGCEGIRNLKTNNQAAIIAQDDKTCVVYGMPKAVVEAGLADKVVPLQEIASQITKMVGVY